MDGITEEPEVADSSQILDDDFIRRQNEKIMRGRDSGYMASIRAQTDEAEQSGVVSSQDHGITHAMADSFKASGTRTLRGFASSFGMENAKAYLDYVIQSNPDWAMPEKQSAAGWLAYQGVNGLVTTAPTVAVGALLPASAPLWAIRAMQGTTSFAQIAGDNYDQAMADSGGMGDPYAIWGASLLNSTFQATIEMGLGPQRYLTEALRGIGKHAGAAAVKGITQDSARKAGTMLLSGLWPKGSKILLSGIEEGAEELLQLASDDVTRNLLSGRPMSEAADYLGSFAAGAWGGVLLGAGAGIIEGAARNKAQKAMEALGRQEPTPEDMEKVVAPHVAGSLDANERILRGQEFIAEEDKAFEILAQGLDPDKRAVVPVIRNIAYGLSAMENGAVRPSQYIESLKMAFIDESKLTPDELTRFGESMRAADSDASRLRVVRQYFPGFDKRVHSVEQVLELRRHKQYNDELERSNTRNHTPMDDKSMEATRTVLSEIAVRQFGEDVGDGKVAAKDSLIDLVMRDEVSTELLRAITLSGGIDGIKIGSKTYRAELNSDFTLSFVESKGERADVAAKDLAVNTSSLKLLKGDTSGLQASQTEIEIAKERIRTQRLARQRDILDTLDAMEGKMTPEERLQYQADKQVAKRKADAINRQLADLRKQKESSELPDAYTRAGDEEWRNLPPDSKERDEALTSRVNAAKEFVGQLRAGDVIISEDGTRRKIISINKSDVDMIEEGLDEGDQKNHQILRTAELYSEFIPHRETKVRSSVERNGSKFGGAESKEVSAKRDEAIKDFEQMAAELEASGRMPQVPERRQRQESRFAARDKMERFRGMLARGMTPQQLDAMPDADVVELAQVAGLKPTGTMQEMPTTDEGMRAWASQARVRLLSERPAGGAGMLFEKKSSLLSEAQQKAWDVTGLYLRDSRLALMFADSDMETITHEWFHHLSTSGLIPENYRNILFDHWAHDAEGRTMIEIKEQLARNGQPPPPDEELRKRLKWTDVSEENAVREFLATIRDQKIVDPKLKQVFDVVRDTFSKVYTRVGTEYLAGPLTQEAPLAERRPVMLAGEVVLGERTGRPSIENEFPGFRKASPEAVATITERMNAAAQPILKKAIGESVLGVGFMQGGWMQGVNPNIVMRVMDKEAAVKAADIMGAGLYQDGMMVAAVDDTGSDSIVFFKHQGNKDLSEKDRANVYSVIYEVMYPEMLKVSKDALIGFTPIDKSEIDGVMRPQMMMVAMPYSSKADTQKILDLVRAEIESKVKERFNFDIDIANESATVIFRENKKHYNWEKTDGNVSTTPEGSDQAGIRGFVDEVQAAFRAELAKGRAEGLFPERAVPAQGEAIGWDKDTADALSAAFQPVTSETLGTVLGDGLYDTMRHRATFEQAMPTDMDVEQAAEAIIKGRAPLAERRGAADESGRASRAPAKTLFTHWEFDYNGNHGEVGDIISWDSRQARNQGNLTSKIGTVTGKILGKDSNNEQWEVEVLSDTSKTHSPGSVIKLDSISRAKINNLMPERRSPLFERREQPGPRTRMDDWKQLHAIFMSEDDKALTHPKTSEFVKEHVKAQFGRDIASMTEATDEELASAAKAASAKYGRTEAYFSDKFIQDYFGTTLTAKEFKTLHGEAYADLVERMMDNVPMPAVGERISNMAAEADAMAELQQGLHGMRPMRPTVAGGPDVLNDLLNSMKRGFQAAVKWTHGLADICKYLDDANENVMKDPRSFTQMIWARFRDANHAIARAYLPVEQEYSAAVREGKFHKNAYQVYELANGEKYTYNEMLVIYSFANGKMVDPGAVTMLTKKGKEKLRPEYRNIMSWVYSNIGTDADSVAKGIKTANAIVQKINGDATLKSQALAEIEWQNKVGRQHFERAAKLYKEWTGRDMSPMEGFYTPMVRQSGDIHEADLASIFESVDGKQKFYDNIDALRELHHRGGGAGGMLKLDYRGNFLRHIEALVNYAEKRNVVQESLATLANPSLRDALRQRFGQDDIVLSGLERLIRREMKPTGNWSDFNFGANRFGKIMQNVYASVFPFNIMTMPTQLTSIFNGMAEIGLSPKAMAEATRHLGAIASHVTRNIARVKAGEVAHLLEGNEIYEQVKRWSPALLRRFPIAEAETYRRNQSFLAKHVPGWSKMIEEGNLFMELGDMGAVLPTWKVIFDANVKLLALEHKDWTMDRVQQKAANMAYDAVVQSQNPSTVTEKNLLQTGPALVKSLIPFTGQAFVLWHNLMNDVALPVIHAIQDNPTAYGKAAGITRSVVRKEFLAKYAGRFIIPAVLMGMIARRRPPEDIKEVLKDLAVYPFTAVPFVGNMIWASMFLGWKGESGPLAFWETLSADVLDLVQKGTIGGGLEERDLEKLARTGGLAAGVPQAFIRIINTAIDKAKEKEKDSTVDWETFRKGLGLQPRG